MTKRNRRRRSEIGLRALAPLLIVLSFAALSCDRDVTLKVQTDPEGAEVSFDGRALGRTPTEVLLPASGGTLHLTMAPEGAEQLSRRDPTKRVALTCSYLPLTANLPLFVALENGYFDRYGLNVTAIEATSPNDILTGIVSGKVDFAAVLAYSLLLPGWNRFPGEFRLFSSSEETYEHFTASIVVPTDSPIQTYQELRGKKIGVYTGLVQPMFLKAMLVGMGIGLDEVEIIQISPRLQIQGLASGQYEALSSTEPTTVIASLQGVAKPLVENPRVKYIMAPFPSTAATISTDLLERDPESAEGVVQALNMAIDFIRAKPEEAKQALAKYTPIPKDLAPQVLSKLRLFRYSKLGEENRLNVQRFADYLFENGLLKERIPDVNVLFGDYQENPEGS